MGKNTVMGDSVCGMITKGGWLTPYSAEHGKITAQYVVTVVD